jgi:hypothetical protein
MKVGLFRNSNVYNAIAPGSHKNEMMPCNKGGVSMAAAKLVVIGWLFVAILVSGLWMGIAGKILHVPFSIAHKLLALLCLVLLVRVPGALRVFQAPPVLPAAIVAFACAYLAAFVTGVVKSVPACASFLWLNLHRVAAGIAVLACAVAARFIAMAVRS